MGLEDDFLKDDLDDEKTIEYIKNYLPQELKEKFSDDEFYYFLDLIDEYYSESGILDAQPDAPIRMRWVTMIRKKSFSSYKVRWNIRNLWTKNSLYQKYRKIADGHGFIRDFLFLCDRWRIQKKEDGRADENDTQYTVEQAGLSPPYILYDKLGVSGSKEPVPVQYGCQQGDDACDGENPLNDVLAHQK